jgi:hypothetical protein
VTYLVPQLGYGTPHDGDNCGPASVAMALRWSTQHDVMPMPPEVRKAFGDPIGGTQMSDHPKAYASFSGAATRAGWTLKPLKFHDADPWDRFLEDISSGHGATMAIDYSRVPKHLKGDPRFDGLHAVFVSRIRTRAETTELRVWDPLCDGRRPGIPRGPLWYPKLTLKAAAAGYAGAGKASWCRVTKADGIYDPPLDPCDAAIRELTTERDAYRDVLIEARSAMVNAVSEIGPVIADIDELIPQPAHGDGTVGEGVIPRG